jgi:hypothetical protein
MFQIGIAQVPHLHSLSTFFCSRVMDLSCVHFLQVGVDDVLISTGSSSHEAKSGEREET